MVAHGQVWTRCRNYPECKNRMTRNDKNANFGYCSKCYTPEIRASKCVEVGHLVVPPVPVCLRCGVIPQ